MCVLSYFGIEKMAKGLSAAISEYLRARTWDEKACQSKNEVFIDSIQSNGVIVVTYACGMQIFPSSRQAKNVKMVTISVRESFLCVNIVVEYDVGGIKKWKQYFYCIKMHFTS